jgi:hypothetical protein
MMDDASADENSCEAWRRRALTRWSASARTQGSEIRSCTDEVTQYFAPPLALLLIALDLLLAFLLAPPLALLLLLALALARLARIVLVPMRVFGDRLRVRRAVGRNAGVRRRQVEPVEQVEGSRRSMAEEERSAWGSP